MGGFFDTMINWLTITTNEKTSSKRRTQFGDAALELRGFINDQASHFDGVIGLSPGDPD
jgi:hypothetical protein